MRILYPHSLLLDSNATDPLIREKRELGVNVLGGDAEGNGNNNVMRSHRRDSEQYYRMS